MIRLLLAGCAAWLAPEALAAEISAGTAAAWWAWPLALVASTSSIAGALLGLGAGWANLPTLNLVMGLPLKVSAGTCGFILSLVDSSAA